MKHTDPAERNPHATLAGMRAPDDYFVLRRPHQSVDNYGTLRLVRLEDLTAFDDWTIVSSPPIENPRHWALRRARDPRCDS